MTRLAVLFPLFLLTALTAFGQETQTEPPLPQPIPKRRLKLESWSGFIRRRVRPF